jgi:hypothetical protein
VERPSAIDKLADNLAGVVDTACDRVTGSTPWNDYVRYVPPTDQKPFDTYKSVCAPHNGAGIIDVMWYWFYVPWDINRCPVPVCG